MFLLEFIKQSQIEYPTISKTPFDVMNHLLFTNGNGISIVNGSFVKEGTYGKTIPFEVYYREELDFNDMVQEYDHYNSEKEISELYSNEEKSIIQLQDVLRKLNKDLLVKEQDDKLKDLLNTVLDRYNELDLITKYSLKDLKSTTFWKRCLKETYEYNPYLDLSEEYFKAYFFNENTNNDLLKVSIALSYSLIEHMEELLINLNFNEKKPLFFIKDEEEINRYKNIYPNDIEFLKTMIVKWQSYIN